MEGLSNHSNKFKDIDILLLKQQQKAERLWQLFNNKMLDIFLRDCEKLQKEGNYLSSLSKLKQYPNDFKIQYESMKRVFQIAMEDLSLSKSSNEGWKVIDIDSKSTISVKNMKTVLYLKVRGSVDLNIKHVCYVAYLIKYYSQCIPFCKQSKDIMQPSRVQKIGYLGLNIPIPFVKNRSALVRGVGFRLSHQPRSIYIFGQGINNEKQYLQRVKIDPSEYMKNRQVLDLKHCVVELKCLDSNSLEFNASATVDHHISFAPEALVVFIAKQLGKFIINNLFDKLRKFESTIWAKQLKENYKENKQFYEWIDGIMNQVMDQK